MAKLQITYTKSAIGYSKDQKATIASLGLRKLNSSVIHEDTPAIRGMAFKVRHLVTVSEVMGEQPAKPAAKPSVSITKAAAQAEPAPRRKAAPAAAEAPAAQAETPAAAEVAAPAEAPASAKPTNSKAKAPAADDLEVIEGIGPKIAGVLKEAGITTFAELGASDASRLSEILHDANLRLADPTTWPEQAQLAADGKWDELKELQDSLKGGRRE